MPQRRHLQNDARLCAIGMLKAGMRQVEVARRLGFSQSVISSLRTRLAQTNSTLDRRRSGRPRSRSQAQDRFLRTSALRSLSVSAEQLCEHLSRTGTRVSVQTMRNRLHSAGLRARRPYIGVPLSQRHRQARLAWTRQHRRWTKQQWATVLFTGGHSFCWICLTDDVTFGFAEARGTRTAPLLNMTGMDLGFTALSRIFHLHRADRSLKVGENRRTRRKTT